MCKIYRSHYEHIHNPSPSPPLPPQQLMPTSRHQTSSPAASEDTVCCHEIPTTLDPLSCSHGIVPPGTNRTTVGTPSVLSAAAAAAVCENGTVASAVPCTSKVRGSRCPTALLHRYPSAVSAAAGRGGGAASLFSRLANESLPSARLVLLPPLSRILLPDTAAEAPRFEERVGGVSPSASVVVLCWCCRLDGGGVGGVPGVECLNRWGCLPNRCVCE